MKIPDKVKIEKHSDWSKVDFVFCNRTGYFSDDVKGNCHNCGVKIVYRPYIPKDVLKLCADCGLKYVKNIPTDKKLS